MEKNEKESRLIAQARATEWKQCRPGLGKAGDPVKNDWTAAKKGKEMKKMYIDASTIITAASVVGGLGVLGGAVAHVVRIVQRDKRQSAAIKATQGLIESGCNGPCKDALGKLDKHLNQKAHTSSTEV